MESAKKRRTDWEGARRSAGLRGFQGFAAPSGGWGAKSPDTPSNRTFAAPPFYPTIVGRAVDANMAIIMANVTLT